MQLAFLRKPLLMFTSLALFWGVNSSRAQSPSDSQADQNAQQQLLPPPLPSATARSSADRPEPLPFRSTTSAQRKAAALRVAAARGAANSSHAKPNEIGSFTPGPAGTPDYFGPYPNYANSPFPTVTSGVVTGGIRKFVDSLPGLGLPGCDPKSTCNANNLGNYIPIAIPDETTFPGSDYYQIGLFDYTWQFHSDLPNYTLVRGYRDLSASADGSNHYLGPIILAQRNKPVRVKFSNNLGLGIKGKLFLPVDTTVMGAGMGPAGTPYTQNRANLHLHGGNTPWISDGTPHQWITPAGETTDYKKGLGFQNVPDMVPGPANQNPSAGDGIATLYWTNQQSSRMMWYHDHSYGLTRLNVYAGEVAGYLLWDQYEEDMISGTNVSGINPGMKKVLPDLGGAFHFGIPLIIQDKTFVPQPAQLAAEDPTWDPVNWGGYGTLWFPHVYMPNQSPADRDGANAMGRWDYGPWFWPPYTTSSNPPLIHGTVPNPYYVSPTVTPWEPAQMPGTPNPSLVPEAFMDTPVVNGTAYPYLQVAPKAYRFRILNGSNDRSLNLQIYYADPAHPTEVKMVPAVPTSTFPATWPTDGRDGGVPDPTTAGPSIVQIGTEGGFLPSPAIIPSTPIGYEYNRRSVTVLNVSTHSLLIGPAERADILIDFSSVPVGSNLILYNDSPAPIPGIDARLDYYTGDPDQTDTGGAPTTMPGYGPNTRTIMQFRVSGAASKPLDMATLNSLLAAAYAASQAPPVVPELAYGTGYGTIFTNTYSGIADTSLTYTPPVGSPLPTFTPPEGSPFSAASCVEGTCTVPMLPKAIQELFELNYGRMNATLGVEMPFTNINTQTTIPLGYIDPVTETMNNGDTQIWKITHNGVDTHFIHFHLFNVQLINRVGWDGTVRPPDANELGWKETIRMNPLEDTIVALKPLVPSVPFVVPDSIRPPDVTSPANSSIMVTSPITGNITTIVNDPNTNFGWEYVWHCHILGHEENDMMRPMIVSAPSYESGVAAVITNPWPGTNFPGSSTVFNWGQGIGNITGYQLLVGTNGPGSSDLFIGGTPSAPYPADMTSQLVSGLPINASPIYVRLLTQINGVWLAPNDYTYFSLKPASNVSLVSSLNPVILGQAVTFTATVTPAVTGVPTGSIEFVEGNVVLGIGQVARATGTATYTTTSLAVGSHPISAEYSGNDSLASNSSAILVQVVNDMASTPDFALSTNPTSSGTTVTVGSSLPYTVTITPSNGNVGSVTLTCYSPVSGITCSVIPQTLANVTQPVNATLTITVSATTASFTVPTDPANPSQSIPLLASMSLAGLFGGLFLGGSGKNRWFGMICLTLMICVMVTGLVACGGSSTTKPVIPPANSSLVGQHSVTVTATGGGSTPVSHVVTVSFTVQQ